MTILWAQWEKMFWNTNEAKLTKTKLHPQKEKKKRKLEAEMKEEATGFFTPHFFVCSAWLCFPTLSFSFPRPFSDFTVFLILPYQSFTTLPVYKPLKFSQLSSQSQLNYLVN